MALQVQVAVYMVGRVLLTCLNAKPYSDQGDEGPVIAKRVAEDRSASVEAPAPAEHCILVKQASCGGGGPPGVCVLPACTRSFLRVGLMAECDWVATCCCRTFSSSCVRKNAHTTACRSMCK